MSDLAGVVPLNAYAVDVARIADYHAGRFSPAQPHSSAGMKRLRGRDGIVGPVSRQGTLTRSHAVQFRTSLDNICRVALEAGGRLTPPGFGINAWTNLQFLQRPTPAAFGR